MAECSAQFGIGYMLSPETVASLDTETYERLIDTDFLHYLCSFEDNHPYLLGVIPTTLNCWDCEYVDLNDCRISDDLYNKVYDLYSELFPHEVHPPIHKYLIARCDV